MSIAVAFYSSLVAVWKPYIDSTCNEASAYHYALLNTGCSGTFYPSNFLLFPPPNIRTCIPLK